MFLFLLFGVGAFSQLCSAAEAPANLQMCTYMHLLSKAEGHMLRQPRLSVFFVILVLITSPVLSTA